MRQTTDEQQDAHTKHANGRGFNGRDAEIMTSFYNQIQKARRYHNPQLLSEKQVQIARRMLPKYWKQVQEEIERKESKTVGNE